MNHLVEAWLALTFAVNSINRSMGLHDLYPFVLGPLAVAKLDFRSGTNSVGGPARRPGRIQKGRVSDAKKKRVPSSAPETA